MSVYENVNEQFNLHRKILGTKFLPMLEPLVIFKYFRACKYFVQMFSITPRHIIRVNDSFYLSSFNTHAIFYFHLKDLETFKNCKIYGEKKI